MKAAAVVLGAVAAFVLYKALSGTTAPVYAYAPPPPAPAKHWYDTALGVLGTVAGNALGSYAAVANRTRATQVPVKTATGQSSFATTGATFGSYTGTDAEFTQSIKQGLR